MKFIQSVLFALITLSVTGNCFILQQNQTDQTSTVERGDSICIKNVPYFVMIKSFGYYLCGGALIEPDIVLTAAHCVENSVDYNMKLSVIAGTDNTKLYPGHSLFDRRIKITAERMVMHPHYWKKSPNATSARHDIALIKLTQKFPITNRIKTISLPKQNVVVDEQLILPGIGKLNAQDAEGSPCLKYYKPTVVDCSRYDNDRGRTDEGIICHTGSKGARTHQGDSGSPLVNSKNELVGIHISSSLTGLFQIATNVYDYLGWIEETINEQFSNKFRRLNTTFVNKIVVI